MVSVSLLLLLLLLVLGHARAQAPAAAGKPAPPPAAASSPTGEAGSNQLDGPLAQAKTLLDQGQTDDADRAVREYLETHPGSADAHFLRGYILFRQIQTHAASGNAAPESYREPGIAAPDAAFLEATAKASLAEFTEGAKYRAPSPFDLKIVALDYVLLHDYVDADKWLTRSLQGNLKDADGWYNLGRAKYNENRFDEAAQCFQQVLKLEPKSVKAGDNLGLSYAGLGQTDAAISAYKTAIAWQSDSAIKSAAPYLDLGVLFMAQNRTQEAVPYFIEAINIAPKESRHHEELGQAYLRLDQTRKAEAELQAAVALSPQNPRLHYLLGRVYSKEGFTEKANLEFSRSESLKAGQSSAAPQP